jgi:hypothetical protein
MDQPAIHGWLHEGADCSASSAGCALRPRPCLWIAQTTSHGWRVRSMGPLSAAEHRRADRVLAPVRGSRPWMAASSRGLSGGLARHRRAPAKARPGMAGRADIPGMDACRTAQRRQGGAPGCPWGTRGSWTSTTHWSGRGSGPKPLCRLRQPSKPERKTPAARSGRGGRAARSAPTVEGSTQDACGKVETRRSRASALLRARPMRNGMSVATAGQPRGEMPAAGPMRCDRAARGAGVPGCRGAGVPGCRGAGMPGRRVRRHGTACLRGRVGPARVSSRCAARRRSRTP